MAKKKLEGIIWPNLPDDEYYLDAEKVEYNEEETYPDGSVGKALQNKANTDGTYESMTVGNAEQLVSNVRVNDKTPYLFRTSGGSVDIGDREYVNGIVGGTVAWNQKARPFSSSNWATETGVTATFNDGEAVFTSTVANNGIKSNHPTIAEKSHAFLFAVYAKAAESCQIVLRIGGNHPAIQTCTIGTSYTYTYALIKTHADNSDGITYILSNSTSVNKEISVKDIQVFDLTQMFGSAIADYIYSLEQANAGAGVAWVKKLFPKPYYAYNAGELKSVSGLVSHDMTGFNQVDLSAFAREYPSSCVMSGDELNVTTDSALFNTGVDVNIPADIAGAYVTYDVKCGTATNIHLRCLYEDGEVEDWGGSSATTWTNTTRRAKNKRIVSLRMNWSQAGTFSLRNLCISLSWDGSRDGEYEPYELHSYPLDSEAVLRGVPKLDTNNKLYYDGDIYEANGTVTRRYGEITFDGTETGWAESSVEDSHTFYCTLNSTTFPYKYASSVLAMCESYVFYGVKVSGYSSIGDKQFLFYYAQSSTPQVVREIAFKDMSVADLTAWKAKLESNPITVVYELDTPTTETADPYNGTQIVNDFGTEEYVFGDSAFPIPVGHDTDYPINLVAKLEMAPNSPAGNGDYILRQVNGENSYVPLVIEDALPTIPSASGSYVLTVTVAEGSDPVLAWTQA